MSHDGSGRGPCSARDVTDPVVGSSALLGFFPSARDIPKRCFELVEQKSDIELLRCGVEKNRSSPSKADIQMVEWGSPPPALLDHVVGNHFAPSNRAGRLRNRREQLVGRNAQFHVALGTWLKRCDVTDLHSCLTPR